MRGYLMFWPGTVDRVSSPAPGRSPPLPLWPRAGAVRPAHPPQGAPGPSALLDASIRAVQRPGVRPVSDWISPGHGGGVTGPTPALPSTVGMYHDMMMGLNSWPNDQSGPHGSAVLRCISSRGILRASGEPTAQGQKVTGFRDAWVKDLTVRLYPEGRHEMLNEANRDEVYRDVPLWLERPPA